MFAVRATKEWNKLSVDIKQSTSVKSLKRSLFKIILDNQILSKLLCISVSVFFFEFLYY